jgi:hypothetical protein
VLFLFFPKAMTTNKQEWSTVAELARRGDFDTLENLYPQHYIKYFPQLLLISEKHPILPIPVKRFRGPATFPETFHQREETILIDDC